MDLIFTTQSRSASTVAAGYVCPCGCHPQVTYERGTEAVTDTCCCGNEFAVGQNAERRLLSRRGFETRVAHFTAPWGESLPAVWAIGPSVHSDQQEHEHAHGGNGHAEHEAEAGSESQSTAATDPVCGMTVDPETARAKGLHSSYQDRNYFFCGKGCKLDFGEDPERYLDPSYVPSM